MKKFKSASKKTLKCFFSPPNYLLTYSKSFLACRESIHLQHPVDLSKNKTAVHFSNYYYY